jgi:hypothetical protein
MQSLTLGRSVPANSIDFGILQKRTAKAPVQLDLFPEALQERLDELNAVKQKDRFSNVAFFGTALTAVLGPVAAVKLQLPMSTGAILTLATAIPCLALGVCQSIQLKFKSSLRKAGFSPNSAWEASLAAEQKQLENTLRVQGTQTFKTK